MVNLIVNIDCGQHITMAETDAALRAAQDVLSGVDIVAAKAEYFRQMNTPPYAFSGLGAIWQEAEQAADDALTAGWRDPDGAHCSLDVA